MRQKVVMILLSVCTASLIGLCWKQQRDNRALCEQCAAFKLELTEQVKRQAAAEHAAAREAKARGTAGAATVGKAASAPQVKAPAEAVAGAGVVVVKAESAVGEGAPMSELAKMMKTPAMRDMVRAQEKGQQDLKYGSLFKCLTLSDSELENLKSLLLDKQMALVDSSMDLMRGSATLEDKMAAGKKMKETTAAYDAQIKALLDDDNYTLYKSFEETQTERMQVTLFKGSLAAGDQMTDEQEDSLIRSMHEARSNFKFSDPALADPKAADPTLVTPERITKMLEDSAKLQEQYVAEAAKVLTPAQLELFKANQKQQQAMQEMGMKMAEKMFGKGKTEASVERK